MIIDSIVLENFGPYEGKQEVILKPEADKPIILFGALNGGGKTTLLDALQLGFFGAKAKTSNNGRLGYKEYLRQCIHRNGDPREGASITIKFRRIVEGQIRNFELQRFWREGIKGIEETFLVFENGQFDDILTEHWLETIEMLLPSGLAHLFFFDGEQIKFLAEGKNTSKILGTAVHSLLGLDIVDRLETDLKILEKRKLSESADPEISKKINQIHEEIKQLEQEQERLAMEEGSLVNETGRASKLLKEAEEKFVSEGGELYLQLEKIKNELSELKSKKNELESKMRVLISGFLPFLLVQDLLYDVENQLKFESEIQKAKILRDELEERDRSVVAKLQNETETPKNIINQIENYLEQDRQQKNSLADEELYLNADDSLTHKIAHLRNAVLPDVEEKKQNYTSQIQSLDEKIARLEEDLEMIPSPDRIAKVQAELDEAKKEHEEKTQELITIRQKKESLKNQLKEAYSRLDKLSSQEMENRINEDKRLRILKHSSRVRETVDHFRYNIVKKHITNIENLVLESFHSLTHKTELISNLCISPDTFETTILDKENNNIPFDRLSEGEKQLLATSLLWGIARACERPIPTVIDTPLGRLDSTHRKHLIERYFPNASHQVILLSTDEEIVGQYYEALKPYIGRSYLLNYDRQEEKTNILEGYFEN